MIQNVKQRIITNAVFIRLIKQVMLNGVIIVCPPFR